MVVNATGYHSIRVRNYEADLDPTRVPLGGVLDPAGVRWIVAAVQNIDTGAREVEVVYAAAAPVTQAPPPMLAGSEAAVDPSAP